MNKQNLSCPDKCHFAMKRSEMLTHYMNDSQHYGKWKEPVLEDQKDVED